MLAEDCYQIGSLKKKHNKTKRKVKKKISKSPPSCFSIEQPLLPNKSGPTYQSKDCIKNIADTQKQMCNTILKISHKMIEISYPLEQKNMINNQSKLGKRSKSQIKNRYQPTTKSKCNSSKNLNFNQLSNIEQVKQQQEIQNSTPIKQNIFDGNINNKFQAKPKQFKNNDYFVSGMVKNVKVNVRQRVRSKSKKQKSLSKVSKSSSIDSSKTCVSCKSKEKYRQKNKSINNFMGQQKKWKK